MLNWIVWDLKCSRKYPLHNLVPNSFRTKSWIFFFLRECKLVEILSLWFSNIYMMIFRGIEHSKGFLGGSVAMNLPANAGDVGLIPGSGRSSGEGNGNPVQYSCLENPTDREAWQGTVHGLVRVGHDWVTRQQTFKTECFVDLKSTPITVSILYSKFFGFSHFYCEMTQVKIKILSNLL